MIWIDKLGRAPAEEDCDEQGCILAWHAHNGCVTVHLENFLRYGTFYTHWMKCPDGPETRRTTMAELFMDAIRDEMAKGGNDYIEMLGELMTEYLRRHPEHITAPDGKTLKGAFDKMREAAKKKQKGGSYAMPPEEIFRELMEYYGMPGTPEDLAACFMAAIGQSTPDAPPEPKPEDDFDLDALMGI